MRRAILAIIGMTVALAASASSLYRDSCYTLGVSAGYGYNTPYEHYGAFTVDANLPIHPYFEGEVNVRALTANTYDFNARLEPKFPLKVGELFFNLQVLYNLNIRNRMHGVCGALSFGYRMDYLHFHFGCGLRMLNFLHYTVHSTENSLFEPHTFIYYVEVFARPHTSFWNISACVTNLTDYQMDRMFTPHFIVNSYVHLNAHWCLKMQATCVPTGLGNSAPSFYGASIGVGGYYRF